MSNPARILSRKVLANAWGNLSEYEIDYVHADGAHQTLKREVYDRGHAAAVLLHDPARDNVVLIRQFRLPPQLNGDNPYLIEVCAGFLDGDDPETCARREALEETGIEIGKLREALTLITSPGSVTEKITCFIGEYHRPAPAGRGKGILEEGEDIEVIELSFDQAFGLIASGEITDAKTVVLLQHLKLARR